MMIVPLALLFMAIGSWGKSIQPSQQPSRKYCQRDDASCWPNAADLAALTAALDPTHPRVIAYTRNGTLPAPIPQGAKQPLFGFGNKRVPPVVVAPVATGACFTGKVPADETRSTCLAATRDNPAQWGPAFVVFPLISSHVVTAVIFARKHNMCVSVLGTGHDFVNRHDGCPDGLLIRTTLMKMMDWDLQDNRGFGWKDGNVRLGSGLTFSEIAQSASNHGRIIAEGWTHSVGVAGWSIGGGHGPFGNWAGLGVDNLLEIELVTANGSLVTANNTHHPHLFWAIRGGGGSVWGVITSLTLRAHVLPTGGFHQRQVSWVGTACPRPKAELHQMIDAYLAWSLTLGPGWSGLVWAVPLPDHLTCGAGWVFSITYVVSGSAEAAKPVWRRLVDNITKVPVQNTVKEYTREDAWTAPLKIPIEVTPWMAPIDGSLGGVPSVLVGRDMVNNGRLAAVLKERIADCNGLKPEGSVCQDIQIYNDITGNLGAPQPNGTSITADFRTALFHVISGEGKWSLEKFNSFYELGNSSYFGESAINMVDFKRRYWGDNYDRLMQIKQIYDPDNFFWCRNCVGSDI